VNLALASKFRSRAEKKRNILFSPGFARQKEKASWEQNTPKDGAPGTPKDGAPGTTDQSPRWEGPKENRPPGYLPAEDDPDRTEDANGETNANPETKKVSDGLKQKGE
jgi:hypothetical protein